MGRFLVLGGFEPSGHDSTLEAVLEAGEAAGHQVRSLLWREVLPIADHPMFVSHRRAAAQGVPAIAGLLDEAWIGERLAEALADRVPLGFDGYVSVHPWSSLIAAKALAEDGSVAPLIDYHSDFGAFPVITHARIDAHLGGGPVRALQPAVRSRCHEVGVAVPARFKAGPERARRSRLVVSAGSDGWAVRAMAGAATALASRLAPEEILLLAPSDEARSAWSEANVPGAVVVAGLTNIAPLLRTARWYLSKGGGTAVAEGLAAGCEGFMSRSGIFWEDEAAAHLHASRVAFLVDCAGEYYLPVDSSPAADAARARCLGAADRLWSLASAGLPRAEGGRERAVLASLVARLGAPGTDPLPAVTAELRRRLEAWRDGWDR